MTFTGAAEVCASPPFDWPVKVLRRRLRRMISAMRKPLSRHLLAAMTLAFLIGGEAAAESIPQSSANVSGQPVVVELFTSQGCSSCPPADHYIGKLRELPNVIALALHVDYWDYIGWKDPFASPEYTARQRGYSQTMRNRFIYTPQMVIDGQYDVVGSRYGEIDRTIEMADARGKPLALSFDAERSVVSIPAGRAPEGGATIYMALYDDRHETEVARGENGGRTLIDYNVVRELVEVGVWHGAALDVALDLEGAAERGRAGCAVLVQLGRHGPILGAARIEFPMPN